MKKYDRKMFNEVKYVIQVLVPETDTYEVLKAFKYQKVAERFFKQLTDTNPDYVVKLVKVDV